MYRHVFILCLWMGGLFGTSIIKAQTFEDGYQSYMRNQFPVAELQFRNALKQAQAKEDRAFILKFIGICQYMRGDKKGAGVTFYQSLSFDPNVTIDEEEVLDASVVGYFMAIKNKWAKDQQAMMARPAPPPVAQTPAPPARVPAEAAVAAEKPAAAPAPKTAKPKRKVAKKESLPPAPVPDDSESKISWLHFLPFGSGQFYNGSYLLGTGLALAEAYSIYRFTYIEERIAEQRALNVEVQADNRITNTQKENFFKENNDFIAELKGDKNLAIAAFAGLWVLGITEAIINAPEPTSSPESADLEGTSSRPLQTKRWQTAWLPTPAGGTFVVGFRLPIE